MSGIENEIPVVPQSGPAPQSSSSSMADGMDKQIERFLNLSTELAHILSELSRKVKDSMDQLQMLRSDIDCKKQELKELHEVDLSVISMKELIEDHRMQKENLMRLMADQNKLWDDEKERLIQEEKAYKENLRAQRQRDEEEYRRAREGEQSEIHRKFEQELQAIRQKAVVRQEEREKDFLRREQILRQKEQESARLIQELESFMSRLVMRANPQDRAYAAGSRQRPLSGGDLHSQAAIVLEEDPIPVWPAINEMALSLGRDGEHSKDGFPAKHESALLQFSNKRPASTTESEC